MQQLIIQTLLKYNEIFDALQQVFQLHNYNCDEQKKELVKYLDQDVKQSCIYLTLNQTQDFLKINEKFLKADKNFNRNLQELLIENSSKTEVLINNKVNQVNEDIKAQIFEFKENFSEFQNQVFENYETINDSKFFQKQITVLIDKLNIEIEEVNKKYVLKQSLDDYLIELRDSIQNISQSISYLRNDVQLLFKNTKETNENTDNQFNIISSQINNLTKVVQGIDICFKEIGQIKHSLEQQRIQNQEQKDKFKALTILFHELEINNVNLIKFEIHSVIRKFDESLLKLNIYQQQLNEQLEKINLNQQLQKNELQQFDEANQLQFESLCKETNNQQKLITQLIKLTDKLKESTSQNNQIQFEFPQELNKFQSKLNFQWKFFYQCFNLTRESLDVVQDYCETLQLPSANQEKDLTNLLILLDRRQTELKKNLFHIQARSRNQSKNILKIKTPGNSQQLDSGRIHSQQPRRFNYSKNGSQTLSVDSKTQTIIQS